MTIGRAARPDLHVLRTVVSVSDEQPLTDGVRRDGGSCDDLSAEMYTVLFNWWVTRYRNATELALPQIVLEISPPVVDQSRSPSRRHGRVGCYGDCELGCPPGVSNLFSRPIQS